MENRLNEISISKCTTQNNFNSMKQDFISAIKEIKKGAKVLITTEKEDDGFITCMTSIEFKNNGHGNFYGDVRFVNPESIMNFILHCAGYTKIGSLGFRVKDISESEVEIEICSASKTKH